jgi:hypothetical protein
MVTSTDYKKKGYMYVIEGNKDDKVGYRHCRYGKNVYKYVLGYGVPYYKAAKTTAEDPIAEPIEDLEPITEPVVEPTPEPVVTEPIATEPVVEPTPTTPTKPATSSSSSKGYRGQVTSKKGLNIRKGPGTNYGIVGTLAYKAKVTVLDKKNGWGKIGSNKWVSLTYIKKV